MTRDDIIRMAREAGFAVGLGSPMQHKLQAFAALVAAAEREECARLCDELIGTRARARHCADAIRAKEK